MTAEKVKNEFLGISEHHETLLDLFKKHNEDVLKLVGISKSTITYQKYERTHRHLERFLLLKYQLKDISLKEIKPLFICDFEIYLMTTGKCISNSSLIAHKNELITNDL